LLVAVGGDPVPPTVRTELGIDGIVSTELPVGGIRFDVFGIDWLPAKLFCPVVGVLGVNCVPRGLRALNPSAAGWLFQPVDC
jgi:hypothetical protein